ncbi:ubiquinol-cytochrome-c reductase cytochrome c1 [Metarhizium guizhouense ARSEF 977]|uniref:Ubiquinol-cytochrome-c reductase cytochrome c1 n=1 Tax=Metarhizium guizhouense (strain ARSEF 977) TaxID=1276136 RepID=A0A0B4GNT9_METGA|nr:ubiquinol-cytochrome-c reductase cytochrome c1 [Metarhizium guizhouense ARSEF 977]
MTQLQTAMEHCCFYFSQKYLPDVLENRGWDCPVATTLDRWVEAIGSSKFFVASHKSGCQSTTAIGEILRSTAHIREVTIHRVGISTERLRKCLESAIALAEVLGQDQQSQQQPELRSLAAQVRSSIQDLEDWDLGQQLFLDAERSNIAKQRAKLDELEAAALKKANHQIEGISTRSAHKCKRRCETLEMPSQPYREIQAGQRTVLKWRIVQKGDLTTTKIWAFCQMQSPLTTVAVTGR